MAPLKVSIFNTCINPLYRELVNKNIAQQVTQYAHGPNSVDIKSHNVNTTNYPRYRPDGIIITGSEKSALADYEWVNKLRRTIKSVIEQGIPVLGISFGCHMLLDVLGGEIEQRDEYKNGYQTINQTADSSILYGLPQTFKSFITHQYDLSELPQNATVVAQTDAGAQAFSAGLVFGIQFHPEFTLQTANYVVNTHQFMTDAEREYAKETLSEVDESTSIQSSVIFENFYRVVESNSQ